MFKAFLALPARAPFLEHLQSLLKSLSYALIYSKDSFTKRNNTHGRGLGMFSYTPKVIGVPT